VIYDIRHVTTYGYESPVSFARCSLRLEPTSGDGQQLISHTVDIRPRPADRTVRRDFFGTHTESILIETPHRHLRIDSRSRVSVSRSAPGRATQGPAWENVRDVAFAATSLGPASPIGYVFASPLVPVRQPVTAYAGVSFPPRGDKGFGYDPIFLPQGLGRTFGEMDEAEKDGLSHRARAFAKLKAALFD